jgi:sulfur-oxidizing protein SoxZ
LIGRALVHVPATAKRGEIIEIKAMVAHVMETGFRIGVTGKPIPRDIINDFVCTYDGEEVFHATFYPAVAANPFLSFFTVATASGTLTFAWTDQNGVTKVQTAEIKVE